MDELSLKKTALERKLKQGEENIAVLATKLERSDEIAKTMCGILDSFNERLHKLEDTIRPIHDETTKLKRLQGNVDKALSTIDKVIAFHSLPEEVEGRIQEGERGDICGPPDSVDGFLKVMERLCSAIDFFTKNGIQSVESTTTVTLYERGLRALAKDFRNQLSRTSSVTVPLPTLMDMVQQPAHEEPPPVEQLQERLVEDLAAIANYLSSHKIKLEEDYLGVYAQFRSNQLRKSLTALKEASQFTTIPPVTSQRRGTITNLLKMESPAKMKMNKPKSVPKAVSSVVMLKGEGQEDELEGCSFFLATTKVFMHLMQSEHSLMMAILPPEHQQEVFDRLTQPAFDQFVRRGEDLHLRAKRELSRQNTVAMLSMCKVVREMRSLEPYYKTLMDELPSNNFSRYTGLADKFEALNLGALEEFVTSVKSDPEKHSQSMPKDGTVHEFTSNTMGFLEQLLEYEDVIGRCLAGGSRSGMARLVNVTERDMTFQLGRYLYQVTNALAQNLEGKSKTYDSTTLQALFLLNNFHFMHSVFQRNARMMSLLAEDDPRVEENYIGRVETQLTHYRKCFNHVASHVTPTPALQALTKGEKLQKNQRQMVKDKFKAFNMEMDELTRIQRSYAIPDSVLRSRVKQGNTDFLVPKYNEFYANFSQVGFTQHPEKYLKYTPQSLEETLNTFFDVTA